MTPDSLLLLTDLMRGLHTAFAGYKRWTQKCGTPQDEELVKRLDVAAQAAKELMRSRFIEGGQAARREWPKEEQ